MKKFKNAVSHNGQRCDVFYVHADAFDEIPDGLILKVHAVCFWNGKLLLVNHSEWNIWGLPGGTREQGESIEQAMKREIQEETNCEVLDYRPISYQKVLTPDGNAHYRLQYICNVAPLGEFISDPAGNVRKILWINPGDYGRYVEDKGLRKTVFQRALSVFRSRV